MQPFSSNTLKGRQAVLDTEWDLLPSGSVQVRETVIHCPCLGGSSPDNNAPRIQ